MQIPSEADPAIRDVIRSANGLFKMPRWWLPDGVYGERRSANDVRRAKTSVMTEADD